MQQKLKVSVYDTYVPKRDGGLMHFDILVRDTEQDLTKIYDYGKAYLKTKGQEGQPLTSKECRFCHIEQVEDMVESSIRQKGYYIIEMEGCQ